MLTVHHLSTSLSHVVVWLMEELGLPYDLVLHQRDARGGSPDSLRAIHPMGRSPTIEDHGLAMIESTGVILYILEAYGEGRLRPAPGTADAMRFYQWLTFVEGSAKPPLVELFRSLHFAANDVLALERMETAAEKPMHEIEAALEGQDTIVPGQFTAADIPLVFYEEVIARRWDMSRWPNMRAHLERMRERPAYRRAVARGGPTMMA